jgi:xanthine dehydrogenase YagT iron-sulfur-binding subunit
MVRKKRPSEEAACPRHGVSRRGFLTSVTAGTLGTIAVGHGWDARAQEAAPAPGDGAMVKVALRVNGRTHRLAIEPRWTLLDVLRDRLGLTGTKPGCERGECGACTVLVDGVARYACLTLALEAEGHEVTTIEGLMKGEELGDVQRAFVEEDAFQCGYCTPGQILAAEGLLALVPDPSAQEIREGLSGNLCRCGAYDHIAKAVRRAADGRLGRR